MSAAKNDQSSRDQILTKVREALSTPTDSHVRPKNELPVVDSNSPTRKYLPFVGESVTEKLTLFSTLSEKLGTEVTVVSSADQAQRSFSSMVQKNNWNKIGFHQHDLVNSLILETELERIDTSSTYSKQELETCDVGVSGCDALVAQTASILVSNNSAGGRALSVLPPHHLVVATEAQLVATMTDGYSVLRNNYAATWPSFISFITGPSRTADIERVLVLGAHGPKRLTVILIAPSQFESAS